MGKRDSGLKAYTVEAICGVTKPRGVVVDPRGAALVRGHFCDVGLTQDRVSMMAVAELTQGGAKWVQVVKVFRDHETEVKSEALLEEMLAVMRG